MLLNYLLGAEELARLHEVAVDIQRLQAAEQAKTYETLVHILDEVGSTEYARLHLAASSVAFVQRHVLVPAREHLAAQVTEVRHIHVPLACLAAAEPFLEAHQDRWELHLHVQIVVAIFLAVEEFSQEHE